MKNFRIRGGIAPPDLTKTIRTMKLTLLLLLVGLIQLSAGQTSSDLKLNLKVRDQKIVEVLDQIEKQTDYRFAYSTEFIDMDRTVSLDVREKSIDEILSNLFAGTDTKHIAYESHIMLYPGSLAKTSEVKSDQQQTVTGTVTDPQGVPVVGASIVIQSTGQGTITDTKGKFTIDVPSLNETLVISFVGMSTMEIPLEGQSSIE